MFVELIYGILSNSLSLISDSAHMLFDSSALAIGLYASFMSKLNPTLLFTYGYQRFQVISGFVNGLFLLFVAFNIFIESIERIMEPQIVYSERMMVVSILGLIINLVNILKNMINQVGLMFFHEHSHVHGDEEEEDVHEHSPQKQIHQDGEEDKLVVSMDLQNQELQNYSQDIGYEGGKLLNEDENGGHEGQHHEHDHNKNKHEHGHCDHKHPHDHDHKHSHNHNDHENEATDQDYDHDHDHDRDHDHDHGHGHDHDQGHHYHHDENLTGVFLHILADTLGSVGALASSLLIQNFKWYISDPITSFVISILIFLSVFPLIQQSLKILLQSYPKKHKSTLMKILDQIQLIKQVKQYQNVRFWAYTSSNLVFSIKIILKQENSKDATTVTKQINRIIKKNRLIKYSTIDVQVEQIEEND